MMRCATLLLLLGLHGMVQADEALAVIAYPGLPKADQTVLQRLYTGRAVAVGEQPATPVNYVPGHPVRDKFLATVLGQNEEQYTGYWLVRRYVGKGAPPKELPDVEAVVGYIQATPGAVGYVPVSKVPPGANVIFKR